MLCCVAHNCAKCETFQPCFLFGTDMRNSVDQNAYYRKQIFLQDRENILFLHAHHIRASFSPKKITHCDNEGVKRRSFEFFFFFNMFGSYMKIVDSIHSSWELGRVGFLGIVFHQLQYGPKSSV